MTDDDDVFAVSPAAFRGQMELLRESDVEVVPLRAALDLLDRGDGGRYVAITFDDAYLDTLEEAVPVLEGLGLPATVFAVSDILEGTATYDWYRDPPPSLRLTDLPRLLAGGLIDIQAHSRTHRRLTRLSSDELHSEIAGCKERLESHLPYRLTSFSYPAGLYGPREVRAVLEAGFRAAVTTAAGVNRPGQPLGELRRTMLYWRDSVRDFGAKLDGALDRPSRAVSYLQRSRSGQLLPSASRRREANGA